MKEKSNELKAILNEIAREENLNRYVIPALSGVKIDFGHESVEML